MRGPEDIAWGNVYMRREQLHTLDARLLVAEERARIAGEALQTMTAALAEDESHVQRIMAEQSASGAEFRLVAETCLMFADAALNVLADAVVEKFGPRDRDRAWSFEQLHAYIRKDPTSLIATQMAPFAARMQGLRVRVALPRSILSVHPPPFLHSGSMRWGPGQRFMIESARIWPNEAVLAAGGRRLREALAEAIPIPDEVEPPGVEDAGWFLMNWAVTQAAEELDDLAVTALSKYMRRNGCCASPSDALTKASDFLLDVATAVGYPPSYWQPWEPSGVARTVEDG